MTAKVKNDLEYNNIFSIYFLGGFYTAVPTSVPNYFSSLIFNKLIDGQKAKVSAGIEPKYSIHTYCMKFQKS